MLLCLYYGPAQAALVTLSHSGDSPISGTWAEGELIEVVLQVAVTGQPGQGFSVADFKSLGEGIFVDTTYLKIHDVLYSGQQIDSEDEATDLDGSGGYIKQDDTWWYNPFTDFIDTASFSPDGGLLEAIAGAPPGAGFNLGLSGPANYLHLVLEVQSGLAEPWMSTQVIFTGQLASYDLVGPNQVDIFGTLSQLGTDMGSGSFAIVSDVVFDGAMLSTIISNWGLVGATYAQGDLTGDGFVGGADYTEVLTRWGQGGPPEAVPEPNGLITLLAVSLASLARRHR